MDKEYPPAAPPAVRRKAKTSAVGKASSREKITLGKLLGMGPGSAGCWCRGFAHGTRYDAFLGMISSPEPGIVPYAQLPANWRKAGRRNHWKQQGVFFRMVKNGRRVINSMGSTGASGGVILFMPMDRSLDFEVYSLSGTDTQFINNPVTPRKEVFDSLKTSRNLSIAEIAFRAKIPFSHITEVYLLTEKETHDKVNTAATWLSENGFHEIDEVSNSQGTYRQFVRHSSADSSDSTGSPGSSSSSSSSSSSGSSGSTGSPGSSISPSTLEG